MATLATLRAQCRLILASVADWPDMDLNAWIADAVRFYSVEFPRALRYDLSLIDRDARLWLAGRLLGRDSG